MSTAEAIFERVQSLPPAKQEEVLRFASTLDETQPTKLPLRNPRGLWAGFDFDISDEDITELRREMWKNFPRDDF